MKICKRSLSILLILSAVLLYLPFTAHAHPFTDVNLNGDYAYAVNYLYNNNIMQGVTSTTFEPNTNVNRGMFVTFLYRFAGEPQEFADIDFIDVPIYFNSFDDFNEFDIDGAKNNGITAYSTYAAAEEESTPDLLEQGYAVLYIDTYGDYTITNAEGETLSKVNGVYSGTMDARLARMIPLGTHAVYMLITHDSEEFCFETAQPSELLGVISSTMNHAVFGQLDYVSMQPDNMEVNGSEIQYVVKMPEAEGADLRTLRFFYDGATPVILRFAGNQIIPDGEDAPLMVEVTSKLTGQIVRKEFSQGAATSTVSMDNALQMADESGGVPG